MPATRAAGAALPVKLVLKDTSVPDSKTAGTQCQYASKYEVHQITSSWQSGSFPKTFKTPTKLTKSLFRIKIDGIYPPSKTSKRLQQTSTDWQSITSQSRQALLHLISRTQWRRGRDHLIAGRPRGERKHSWSTGLMRYQPGTISK